MATFTITIPDADLEYALARGAEPFHMKVREGFKATDPAFVQELSADVANYLQSELIEWFHQGINNDLYGDFVERKAK